MTFTEMRYGQAVDDQVKHHFEVIHDKFKDSGYTPWVTMLYGSQNYGLATEESDVDTKTMMMPTLGTALTQKKQLSAEVTFDDGSLDQTKDVREMFYNYLKGNINFIETLYTPHFYVTQYQDLYAELRKYRTDIARSQPRALLRMAGGMAQQKYVAFDKPFEGKKEVLAKYGYDPKQLHHLARLYFFMLDFLKTSFFEWGLYACHPNYNRDRYTFVMGLKTDPPAEKEARELREKYMDKINELYNRQPELPETICREQVEKFLNDLSLRLLTRHMKGELGIAE